MTEPVRGKIVHPVIEPVADAAIASIIGSDDLVGTAACATPTLPGSDATISTTLASKLPVAG